MVYFLAQRYCPFCKSKLSKYGLSFALKLLSPKIQRDCGSSRLKSWKFYEQNNNGKRRKDSPDRRPLKTRHASRAPPKRMQGEVAVATMARRSGLLSPAHLDYLCCLSSKGVEQAKVIM